MWAQKLNPPNVIGPHGRQLCTQNRDLEGDHFEVNIPRLQNPFCSYILYASSTGK